MNSVVSAQTATSPLRIGDQMPDVEFTNILNSNIKSIKLSDLRGKIVLLDLWATNCASCITAMPKLDAVQRKFKDEIVIIPITPEPEDRLQQAMSKIDHLQGLLMPFVYGTEMGDYFSYKIISHVVWLDRSGKIINTSFTDQVTEENIHLLLQGKQPNIKTKHDFVDANRSLPYIAGGLGSYRMSPDEVLYSSLITKGTEGLGGGGMFGGGEKRTENNTFWNRTANASMPSLYRLALGKLELISIHEKPQEYFNTINLDFIHKPARMYWETRDSSLYDYRKRSDRKLHDGSSIPKFNFELILPASDSSRFREYQLNELNHFFGSRYGIEGVVEKRTVPCYALTIIGPEKLFKSKGGKREFNLERKGVRGFKITNFTLNEIMYHMHMFYFDYDFDLPIINETNYLLPVDLDLGDVDPEKFEEVNEALKKVGLEFKLVERELDMIVIRDKQP